ncbi:hypothetical protein LZ31DRAFT_618160 [Colletotrichum somersetense]|nr:hypothetical protein LZ31DRAFT_618160 [Colletotrichum somersetense]
MGLDSLVDEKRRQCKEFSKPTLYLLDSFHPDVEAYCRQNFNSVFPGDPDHEHWRKKARYILVRSSVVTAEDLTSSPNLLAIGKQGVGIDNINGEACAARGIRIFNTPGVNARAVAEIVLTLATAAARGLGRITSLQTQGVLVPKETCTGQTLQRRSIGIIGMGHIGQEVASIFRGAFESPVIAYDPFLPANAWPDIPHTRAASIEQVLREADIVTLHTPLTAQTRNMISYPQLQIMKRTAILINAARGAIINEADLEKALREGLIWGVGLDCHEQEPPSKDKYGSLWELGVVSTPHIGAATEQTRKETGMMAARRVYEFAMLQQEVM